MLLFNTLSDNMNWIELESRETAYGSLGLNPAHPGVVESLAERLLNLDTAVKCDRSQQSFRRPVSDGIQHTPKRTTMLAKYSRVWVDTEIAGTDPPVRIRASTRLSLLPTPIRCS